MSIVSSMQVICPKCAHTHRFGVEVEGYKGFVCVQCHSYFKGESPSEWTFVKVFAVPENPQWATLAESVQITRTNYTIVSKIQRLTQDQAYSNEYVGLSPRHKEIYFSDGADFACVLRLLPKGSLQFTSESGARYKKSQFNLEYKEQQQVLYAEGFVFEDLEKESTVMTYLHATNPDRFLSREMIDNEEEHYSGNYWERTKYFALFMRYSEYVERKQMVSKQIFTIAVVVALLLGLLFYVQGRPYMRQLDFHFDEQFAASSSANVYIGRSFVLDSDRPQQLTFKGISEANLADVILNIKLVNETSNAVYQVPKAVRHYFNDINYASGIDADFCKIEPGNYHFVFEASSPVSSEKKITLQEDYKVTYGGLSYIPLIVGYVLFLALIIGYRYILLSDSKSSLLMGDRHIGYVGILKFKSFGLLLFLVIAGQVGLLYWLQNSKTCSTTVNYKTLEDHTYTGSRVHYFRRTFNDYGSSHK